MNVTAHIISRTAIYGIGTMLRGLASFLLLPLYTTYLTTADYGLVELISIVIDLATILLGSRVAVGIFKYYSDAGSTTEKSRVIGSALFLLLIVNVLSLVVLFLSADGLARLLQAPEGFAGALRLFSIALVFGAVNEIFFAYLRIKDRPIQYVLVNLFKLLMQMTFNIVLIVYMEAGYWGIIIGAVLSNAILAIYFTLWVMPEIGFHVGRKQCRDLVSFSLPILLSSVGMYYITFGDRYFLQHFQGIDAVGVYALAYKFGFMLFSLIWVPFSTYWGAQQFEYAKQSGAGKLFGNVFFFANVILLAAAAGVIVLTPHFIHQYAQPGYWGAVSVIPWIVAAYTVQCWIDYFRFGIMRAAQTRYFAYESFIAVVFITIFYLYWIPKEGPAGAAKATLAAFIIRFIFVYYFSQRLFPIQVPWYRLFIMVAYFASVCLLLNRLVIGDVWAFFVKGSIVVLGLAGLLFIPIVSAEHRSMVWSRLARFKRSSNV